VGAGCRGVQVMYRPGRAGSVLWEGSQQCQVWHVVDAFLAFFCVTSRCDDVGLTTVYCLNVISNFSKNLNSF
jgi:hypothetical protein